VLHEPYRSPLAQIRREASTLAASGAGVLVVAAALPGDSYDRERSLSQSEWSQLARTLREAAAVATSHGMVLAFHPHAGTAVAKADDVRTLLDRTDVAVCLDTGHVFLGGMNPVDLVSEAAGRIRHVHLKDVDASLAAHVRAGDMSYKQAVHEGLYTPLGAGDLDIDGVHSRLQDAGYSGWYVLEQDTALTAEPAPHTGPAAAARQSLDYFRRIAGAVKTRSASKEE
jgi:inosose dehydratase